MRLHSRSTIRSILPVLAVAIALPAMAWTSTQSPLTLQPESRLWVDGTSSLKSFSCKAGVVNAVVDASPTGITQVIAGEKGIRSVRLTVPADKLDCANGTMNEHMRKALKVDANPTIEFKLSSYDVSHGADGATGTLKGTLTLGGVQKTIAIPAEGKSDAGALRVTGAYEVKMSDYDLKAPSLMFGRIKVRDAVTVKFDLLLKS